jgi:hypothetical protein
MPNTGIEAVIGTLFGMGLFVPAVRAVLCASTISFAIVVVSLQGLDGLVENAKVLWAATSTRYYFLGGIALSCLVGLVLYSRRRSK